jgi:mycothiol synthase
VSLVVRPPRPADVGAAAALMNAYDAEFGGDGGWTGADMADEWRRASAAVAPDVWLVERDGELAGCATLRPTGHGALHAFGCTHPVHTGHGVGTLLAELAERRAIERAGDVVVRNSVLLSDAGACRLLESRGYAPGPHNVRMRADLEAPPPPPAPPAGVVLASFRPGRDDGAVDACVVEAFDGGWTHQAEFRRAKMQDPRFDPALWVVAREGADVCGAALCMPRTFGMGFVDSLAVRAPWRRRGVGAALLGEAFARLWRAGERSVGLSVDADNPAAVRLYERAGMRIAWRAVPYERELRA